NLRVWTMTPGLIWLVLCNYCRFATIARLTPSPRARAQARPLFWRRDAENPTRGAVGGEPERAVRPVANIANAFAQPLQEALLLDHLVAVELEPRQKLTDQRADEEVAAPGRQLTAGV